MTQSKSSKSTVARGSKPTRSTLAAPLEPIVSGEEFDLEEGQDNITISEPEEPESPGIPRGPANANSASDIFYFFRDVEFPDAEDEAEKVQRACKICLKAYGSDKSKISKTKTKKSKSPNYFYSKNTANQNLRRHLYKLHADDYDQAVKDYQWNFPLSKDAGGATTRKKAAARIRPVLSFSPAVFLQYLIRFIVADDQSIRVVECPEFRHLLLVLREDMVDADIPHRDKVREAIIHLWKESFEILKAELSDSCGKISFTSDIWSDGKKAGFLALTAHWISLDKTSGRLSLKAALIGFHRLKENHTGINIARTILHLLDRANVTVKIGHFTLDNAENNAVAMKELQSRLAKRREISDFVNFDHRENRIRCYAHIINICSSHIVASVTSTSKSYLGGLNVSFGGSETMDQHDDSDASDDGNFDEEIKEQHLPGGYDKLAGPKFTSWVEGIKRDPLKRAKRVVRLLRSSDERRTAFRTLIQDGNDRGWFKRADSRRTLIKVPLLEPLVDVKTRWDSVYLLLRRLRRLRPAVDMFLETELSEFSHCKLSELDWEILEGLETVLKIPHRFQQAMSSESTPVLLHAISHFEMFMMDLERLGETHEILRFWTEIGVHWATKYYIRMDDTAAYVVTMFLNPANRLSWIEKEWEQCYIQRSKEMILNLMRRYHGQSSSMPVTTELDDPAPVAPLDDEEDSDEPTRFQLKRPVYERDSPSQVFTVDAEYRKYASGALSSAKMDILRFWEANKTEFPTLYAIAMDYLPIQATSVPCERVFSSAKETDTAKRNRVSPVLMEALQLLKFLLKKTRLNFMEGWATPELAMRDMLIPDNDLLGNLLIEDPDNPDAPMDAILKDFLGNEADGEDSSTTHK